MHIRSRRHFVFYQQNTDNGPLGQKGTYTHLIQTRERRISGQKATQLIVQLCDCAHGNNISSWKCVFIYLHVLIWSNIRKHRYLTWFFLQTWKCQSRFQPVVLFQSITFWTQLLWMSFGWYWNMCSPGPSNLLWAQVLLKEQSKNTVKWKKIHFLPLHPTLVSNKGVCSHLTHVVSHDGGRVHGHTHCLLLLFVYYESQQSRDGLFQTTHSRFPHPV